MSIPKHLHSLLNKAFEVIDNWRISDDLAQFAAQVYEIAYQKKLKNRTREDNRPEHELVVLRNTMRICWRSGHERESGFPFDRRELRIAVATSLLHDLRFTPRVTEEMIEDAEGRSDYAKAEKLRKKKAEQRLNHMRGSAEDTLEIFRLNPGIMTDAECRQCVGYINLHDIWKLDWPYPVSSDWLAVCCLEGDALWPLDADFGPLADLERKDILDPTFDQLKQQAKVNLDTQLRAYRKNFTATTERFQDHETIIRSSEGARILKELRRFWGI